MIIVLWAQVGFAMVLLSSAIKGVPGDTLEAARIDGANERQIFRRVVIPQMKGTIITVLHHRAITVMKFFDIIFVTTAGDFNTNVIGNEFYLQLTTNGDKGSAAAIVVMLMVAMLPVLSTRSVISAPRRQTDERHRRSEHHDGCCPQGGEVKGKGVGDSGRANWLVHLIMGVLAFIWMVPTSASCHLLPALDDAQATGWWTACCPPTGASGACHNYKDALDQQNMAAASSTAW